MQDKEFPQRKNLRLRGFDYSSHNCYLVTVCVKDRKPLLSNVVGDDAHIIPKKIILKPYGEIAEKHILRINTMYQNVYIEKYIIMPNHIHMLIFINRYENGTMKASSKEGNNNDGTMRASSPTNANLSSVVRTFKTMVTKEIGIPIWQRSFHDEIIKSETHFQNAWNYVAFNALKEYSK
ncbi:MAG: hypothetical protein K2G60_05750 [Oscillospiraceae bacterium]|nr:hypothetical protein [Oscillospiraceae bacterium]